MDLYDAAIDHFLRNYLLGFGALLAASLLARAMRGTTRDSRRATEGLDAFELAYLVDGPERAAGAALASLVQRGAIEVSDAGYLEPREDWSGGPEPLPTLEERALHVLRGPGPIRPSMAVAILQQHATGLRDTLCRRDLELTPGRLRLTAVLTKGLLAAWVALGFAALAVASAGGARIESELAVVAASLGLVLVLPSARSRTTRGDRAVPRLLHENSALVATATTRIDTLSAEEVALAFALLGPRPLIGSRGVGAFADELAARADMRDPLDENTLEATTRGLEAGPDFIDW